MNHRFRNDATGSVSLPSLMGTQDIFTHEIYNISMTTVSFCYYSAV